MVGALAASFMAVASAARGEPSAEEVLLRDLRDALLRLLRALHPHRVDRRGPQPAAALHLKTKTSLRALKIQKLSRRSEFQILAFKSSKISSSCGRFTILLRRLIDWHMNLLIQPKTDSEKNSGRLLT